MILRRWAAAVLVAGIAGPAALAQAPDPARSAAQIEAMKTLHMLDGVWTGEAWYLTPQGRVTMRHTERSGPMLNGAVHVIEGKSYGTAGVSPFNAFAIISYDPDAKAYSMRSYAQGRVGDFAIKPRPDGFSWEIPAGPATMRYHATVQGDRWVETGERIAPGQPPLKVFEMTLKRTGATDWPAGGAVPDPGAR